MTRLSNLIALCRAALDWSNDDTPRELERLRGRVAELEQTNLRLSIANAALEQDAETHRVLWRAQGRTMQEWARMVRGRVQS
jgi:hypothetical protein